jgi:hypothetical protein
MTEEYRSVRPSDFMRESHASANGQPDGSGSIISSADSVSTFLDKVSSIIASTLAGCMGKEDDSIVEGGGGERRERGDRGRYETFRNSTNLTGTPKDTMPMQRCDRASNCRPAECRSLTLPPKKKSPWLPAPPLPKRTSPELPKLSTCVYCICRTIRNGIFVRVFSCSPRVFCFISTRCSIDPSISNHPN